MAVLEIVPYQPSWPNDFKVIAGALRKGLGAKAIRIDHIGSTAVPGLAAKNIIDIQVTVAAFDDDLLNKFEMLGYSRAENITSDHQPAGDVASKSEWEKWFFNPPRHQRFTNTHVRLASRANQRYSLLFRDYLRRHLPTAEAYCKLKMLLATELKDPKKYPSVKDPAVDLIYFAAENWASQIGWQPCPTDA